MFAVQSVCPHTTGLTGRVVSSASRWPGIWICESRGPVSHPDAGPVCRCAAFERVVFHVLSAPRGAGLRGAPSGSATAGASRDGTVCSLTACGPAAAPGAQGWCPLGPRPAASCPVCSPSVPVSSSPLRGHRSCWVGAHPCDLILTPLARGGLGCNGGCIVTWIRVNLSLGGANAVRPVTRDVRARRDVALTPEPLLPRARRLRGRSGGFLASRLRLLSKAV